MSYVKGMPTQKASSSTHHGIVHYCSTLTIHTILAMFLLLLVLRYNTKVSQLHPPLRIHQHIRRLDITMQHPLIMKIAQSPYYLVGNGSNGIRYQCCRLIPGGTFVIVHECSLKFYFYQAITME